MLNENLENMKNSGCPVFFENFEKNKEKDENNILNGARAEIEKVVKKDDLFIKYTDFLKEEDFKNIERRSSTFSDIEEQWGFFLNSVEGKEEKEIQEKFSIFIDELKKAKAKSCFMKNSGFVCQLVSQKLYNNIPDKDEASILGNILNTIISWFSNEEDRIKQQILYSEEYCEDDIKINPDLSFITYYYFGITQVFLDSISSANTALKKSIELIEKDCKFLTSFVCMISGYNFDKLVESLKKKFTLYNNIKEAILLPSLNLVKNAERKILIKKKIFKNVFESLEKYNIQEEIESLYNIGFDSVFF